MSQGQDLRSQIAQLDTAARRSLEDAAGLALSMRHAQVTLAHWLVTTVEKNADVQRWLASQSVDRETMARRVRMDFQWMPSITHTPTLSHEIVALIAAASAMQPSNITTLDLIRAVMLTPAIYQSLLQLAPEFRPLPLPPPPTSQDLAFPDLMMRANEKARCCVLLKRWGPADKLAGSWQGPGVVPATDDRFEHWLSFDCKYLAPGMGPSEGIISLYTDGDDPTIGAAWHSPTATLKYAEGLPLFGHTALSLPPPIELSAEDNELYEKAWQADCPLYTELALAVLGGWHFPWPDGDWEELRDGRLLAWTIAESEPWVELWQESDGFRVRPRTK